MLLDYVYLIIILLLISGITFFIYLSYEYRVNEYRVNEYVGGIETFLNPTLPLLPEENTGIVQNLNNYLTNYDNLLNTASNNQIMVDENGYNNLLRSFNNNQYNSQFLLKESSGIKPPSQDFPVNQLIKTIKSNYVFFILFDS